MDSTVKEGRFQERDSRKARRASLAEVKGSMSCVSGRKALRDDLWSLGFTPILAKPEMEKGIGKRRTRS